MSRFDNMIPHPTLDGVFAMPSDPKMFKEGDTLVNSWCGSINTNFGFETAIVGGDGRGHARSFLEVDAHGEIDTIPDGKWPEDPLGQWLIPPGSPALALLDTYYLAYALDPTNIGNLQLVRELLCPEVDWDKVFVDYCTERSS